MKKRITLTLVMVLALTLLAACSNNNSGNNNFKYGHDFMANNLKGDFSITYKFTMTGNEGEDHQVFMRTSEGYYFSVSGIEMLHVKNGDMYDAYMNLGGGSLEHYGEPITKEQVEESFTPISTMKVMEQAYGSMLKKDGAETIVGRSCDIYSATINGEGGTGKLSYSFDQQTGILLKWSVESTEGSMIYECTEFKTSGVTLPTPN